MKRTGEQKFYIKSNNLHLLSILDDNYYMELGVVALSKIDRLINHQVLELSNLIYDDILNTGIGKITDDSSNDADYQLNYLLSLRQKRSSNKFFLTCGTIIYYDNLGNQKYAPVVLIPIEIDYRNGKVISAGSPMTNRLLLKKLSTTFRDTKEEQNRFIDYYSSVILTNIGQIDKYMEALGNETGYNYSPCNYLTVCNVEYYDFTINNDYFNVERSVYEVSSEEVIKDYFKEVRAILPTNMDQKYVILKALHGDSFTVDGRLGSGKTYTILNIIVDAIFKGKKVLYVDQDLDNVWDLEKNLKFLGLDSYIYNLTKSLREIEVPKMNLPFQNNIEFTNDDLDFLNKFENDLDSKEYGFPIRYILETLAVLNNTSHTFLPLKVENIIQKYETMDLYVDLQKVEKAFDVIVNYDQNIWKNLNISHNNFTIKEIEDRANRIYNIHIRLNQEVEEFCDKYSIMFPNNINDLDRLVGNIVSFDYIKPLASWKDVDIRQNALDAVREIQNLSDINYNSINYYETNINKEYKIGTCDSIFKELCGKYYRNVNENSDNIKYLDRLLEKEDLTTLINKLGENQEHLVKYQAELSKSFDNPDFLKEITFTDYKFINALFYFISNNVVYKNWCDLLISDYTTFTKIGQKVETLYGKAYEIHSKYAPYVLPDHQLYFDEINTIISTREVNLQLKKSFNKIKVRQKHISTMELIKDVKEYHGIISEIRPYVVDSNYRGTRKTEVIISSFINFYNFCKELTPKQIVQFYKIVPRNKKESRLNLDSLHQALKNFKEECEQADKLSLYLEELKIIVTGSFGFDKKKELKQVQDYLKKVVKCKKELQDIFINSQKITTNQILELIQIDEQYTDNKHHLEENSNRYQELLGENYKGFDTIISDMVQTLDHFDDFIKRLKENVSVEALFENETLTRLIDNGITLRKLCTEWFNAFRSFSLCFKGGNNIIQMNSFKANNELLTAFSNTTYQIEHILFINEVLKKCKLYGLENLSKLIIKAKPKQEIADSYLYVVVKELYNIIKNEKPHLLDFDSYENVVEKYNQYELDYCARNIEALSRDKEKSLASKLTNIKFDDYNRIVEILSKHTNIFLSDLNIFNSDFDLQLFDLVIIDDGHLSSANKYNRINECKQCIIFGDKSSQSSIVNTLMQRVSESCIVPYHNRYIRMSSRFNNLWANNNRYIYNYDTKISRQMVNSTDHFAIKVVEFFEKNPTHIINVLVGIDATRRKVYEAIVSELEKIYSGDEIIKILCYNIRIIDATTEGARYVNDVMIYFNDFQNLEQNQKELIFKNFVVVSNNVHMYYVGTKIDEQNELMLKNINNTIGKTIAHPKKLEGISIVLLEKLKQKNLKVREGFGYFDLIIDEKNTVAILLIGKVKNEEYSLLDEYNYYYHQYQRNGWIVEPLYMSDLIDNFDNVIDELVELAKNER